MSDEIRLRVAESPVGGARIAFSHLAVVLGLVVAGLVLAMWLPVGDVVCGGEQEGAVCGLGWFYGGVLLGVGSGTALTGFAFRLGWEWWLAIMGILLAVPLASPGPGWVLATLCLLAPAAAGAATWSGPARPAWRPWAIGGVVAAVTAATLVAVLV